MPETITMSTEDTVRTAAPERRPIDFSISSISSLLQRRAFWLALLLLTALCYFGSYYRHGINFRDEGGTVALLAKRLLDGETPFKDVVLGYNVMWFYPVVALFKVTGVSFVALRVYCFALSTLTATLGFLTVDRVSRRPWLAFLVGLMLVLVPGMTFKNYMPLMAVANSFCLVHFVLAACGRRNGSEEAAAEVMAPSGADFRSTWKWLCIGAAVVGLTCQIRVDVGMFFTLLWLGVIVLRSLERGLAARSRALLLFAGPAALLAIVCAMHLPVYLDAKHRGFDTDFLDQYRSWPTKIRTELEHRFGKKKPQAAHAATTTSSRARLSAMKSPAEPTAEVKPTPSQETLRRAGLEQLAHGKSIEERLLPVLLYAPLVSLAALIVSAVLQLAKGLWTGGSEAYRRPLAALALLGGALTVFPQYFFFRPDAPHLSEFSPSFWTATVSACVLLGAFSGGWKDQRALLPRIFLCFLAAHAALYLWCMLPNRWTGTIAARKNRTQFFKGENGVNIYVTKREMEGLQAMLKTIREHSKAGDYLVAYPYHPAINLLANRRTYEKNVYIDNATRNKNWDADAIARFEEYKPAVIVLSEWAINDHEASKFSVWAAKTKAWIQEHYELAGIYTVSSDNFEVYTRKGGE